MRPLARVVAYIINRKDTPMKRFKKIIYLVLIPLVLCFLTYKATLFYNVLDGMYATPWYDSRAVGLLDPITNFCALVNYDNSQSYFTYNDSEVWRVKETIMFGKRFWTITDKYSPKEFEKLKGLLCH